MANEDIPLQSATRQSSFESTTGLGENDASSVPLATSPTLNTAKATNAMTEKAPGPFNEAKTGSNFTADALLAALKDDFTTDRSARCAERSATCPLEPFGETRYSTPGITDSETITQGQ